jgi:AcrR family transcriptional regulator
MRILATKGARRFTVQLLAKEIGITGGAIYRHFESMEAIVDAVIQRVESILFRDFPPRDADPLARLQTFFHRRTKAIAENPHISRLLLTDHLAQAVGPAQARRLDEFKRRSRGFVMECLGEAQRAGMLAEGSTPEAGAVLVIGSILSSAHAGTKLASAKRAERFGQDVWALIEHALRGGSPAGDNKDASRPRRRGSKKE